MSDTIAQTYKRCSICSLKSPQSTTNYTLISTKHAWRMILKQEADGRREPVWFCPKCWEKRKQQTKL